MSTQKSPPKIIDSRKVEARVLRQKIWKRCNVEDLHFMGTIVGREGSGKSWTALSIAEKIDPSFHAERVMFDPESFLRRLKEWKAAGETQGKAIVVDEAGVGVGVRSWYEKDQIKFNQVLQVIRDENMATIFTLPALGELDSMSRTRLHALLEMTDKDSGEWAELKWKNMDPDRTDKDGKIYKKYPRMRVNGFTRRIKRLRFTPPDLDVAEKYEARKDDFQEQLYQDALDAVSESGEGEDGPDLRGIADEIMDECLSEYVSVHKGNKMKFVNKSLIKADYGLSHRKADTVKQLVEREADVEAVSV